MSSFCWHLEILVAIWIRQLSSLLLGDLPRALVWFVSDDKDNAVFVCAGCMISWDELGVEVFKGFFVWYVKNYQSEDCCSHANWSQMDTITWGVQNENVNRIVSHLYRCIFADPLRGCSDLMAIILEFPFCIAFSYRRFAYTLASNNDAPYVVSRSGPWCRRCSRLSGCVRLSTRISTSA